MKLGESSSNFTPSGDSSTKLQSQVPVTISFIDKDASDTLGSGGGQSVTNEQAINIFNSYIINTKLSKLLDVDSSLDNAPVNSIFKKSSDGKWTYSSIAEYALQPATSSILGGVKIGNGINVDSDGLISIIFPSGYILPHASNSVLGGVRIGNNINIDGDGIISIEFPSQYVLPRATTSILGGIMVGNNLSIDSAGILSANTNIATSSILGSVKIGNNINIDSDGIISVTFPSSYMLPTSTTTTLGGIKVGAGLNITSDGLLSSQYATPIDGILSWDGEKYMPFTTKKISNDGYPYFYNESSAPSFFGNYLKLDGGFIATSLRSQLGSSLSSLGPASLNIRNGSDAWIEIASNVMHLHGDGGLASVPIIIGDGKLQFNSEYLTIDDYNRLFDINMSTIKLSKGIPSKWLALDSSRNIVYMDAPGVSYTHPTQSAIYPTLSGAKVLSSIIVNTLGHVTSISTRTLTLSDLGYSALDISNFVSGPSSSITNSVPIFNSTSGKSISGTNIIIDQYDQMSINSSVDSGGYSIGLSSYANGDNGYGVIGLAKKSPVMGCSLNTNTTGRRNVFIARGDSSHTVPSNGYAIDYSVLIPYIGWTDPLLSEKPGSYISTVITDVTSGSENVGFDFWSLRDGVMTKQMSIDSMGNISSNNTSRNIFTLTLPSAGSVSARCSGAVSGVDYPAGWSIGSDTNPNDLLITHSLGRRIVSVSVYTVVGASERLLYANAAYSGIIAPTSSTLRIEGLATVGTPIVIHCVFA